MGNFRGIYFVLNFLCSVLSWLSFFICLCLFAVLFTLFSVFFLPTRTKTGLNTGAFPPVVVFFCGCFHRQDVHTLVCAWHVTNPPKLPSRAQISSFCMPARQRQSETSETINNWYFIIVFLNPCRPRSLARRRESIEADSGLIPIPIPASRVLRPVTSDHPPPTPHPSFRVVYVCVSVRPLTDDVETEAFGQAEAQSEAGKQTPSLESRNQYLFFSSYSSP